MKFSVAAIVLSQSLPTRSETPVRAELSLSGIFPRSRAGTDILRAAQEKRLTAAQRRLAFHMKGLNNGPRILKSNVYCDPSSTDADTGILSCGNDRTCQASLGSEFGGICVPKTNAKKQSSAGHAFRSSLQKLPRQGTLINQARAANPVPCNPTSGDIGILACGQDQVCKVDKTSELGGYCSRASIVSRRLDTVGICDPTSPEFLSYCDCTGFDNTTGTGVVDCLFYEDYTFPAMYSACEGISFSASIAYSFEDSVPTEYTGCYELKTPYYQKLCNTYLASDGSCSLTFNGQPCSTCNANENSTFYDCSNVEGGVAGADSSDLIPAFAACFDSLAGNYTYSDSNCTLCSAGDYMAYANYGINVTIPGVGELACGYLAIAEILSLIPEEVCSMFSEAAQSSCCAYRCDLCGPTAYVPAANSDTPLNLAIPGYEGLTCGDFAYAAYANFTIPDGTCGTIAGLIQPTCCEAIPSECSLCDGPLTNPSANVTVEGYSVRCSELQSFLTVLECAAVATMVSPVCCSVSSSAAPGETPTAAPTAPAAPGESGGDAPTGSDEPETPDAARSVLTRGGFVSSVVGVMIAAVMLVAGS